MTSCKNFAVLVLSPVKSEGTRIFTSLGVTVVMSSLSSVSKKDRGSGSGDSSLIGVCSLGDSLSSSEKSVSSRYLPFLLSLVFRNHFPVVALYHANLPWYLYQEVPSSLVDPEGGRSGVCCLRDVVPTLLERGQCRSA